MISGQKTEAKESEVWMEVIRAQPDGSVVREKPRLARYYHRNPLRRWWKYLGHPRASPIWVAIRNLPIYYRQALEQERDKRDRGGNDE